MKAKKIIFKRKISMMGILLFIIINCFNLLMALLRWSIKKIYNTIQWTIRYIHFVKSGYCYSDINILIKNMSGHEFEKFCYLLFKELGYSAKLTKATNDYGRDIILKDNENNIIYVECKRWKDDNLIGRPIIQKLSGAMSMFNANYGIVITTSYYHKNAIEASNMIGNIELWDITNIMKLVLKINQRRIPYILNRTLESNLKIIRLNKV